MSQFLKDEVQQRIQSGALDVFAEVGYANATIAAIAQRAKVSTGNVYRYFETKEVLFDVAIPDSFVKAFRQSLRNQWATDQATPPKLATLYFPYAETLAFATKHRRELITVLVGAQGTRLAGLVDKVVTDFGKQAISHFSSLNPTLHIDSTTTVALRVIYRTLMDHTALALQNHAELHTLELALNTYARFHLSGLEGLFR